LDQATSLGSAALNEPAVADPDGNGHGTLEKYAVLFWGGSKSKWCKHYHFPMALYVSTVTMLGEEQRLYEVRHYLIFFAFLFPPSPIL
jgi:hypothetical protein